MMGIVIGISGKRGSGKTTFADDLANKLGWKVTHFGRLVRAKANTAGLGDSIEELQALGESLVKEPHNFCADLLKFCDWQIGENLIVDGIRHLEVADVLAELVHPSKLFLIAISVNEQGRLSRLKERDGCVPENISRLDGHSTEVQVGTIIERRADLVIRGDESLEEIMLAMEYPRKNH